MTDRDDLADRLDAVEEELADADGAAPLFSYGDADGEPAPDRGGPLFHLPREVTDNWGRIDGDDPAERSERGRGKSPDG